MITRPSPSEADDIASSVLWSRSFATSGGLSSGIALTREGNSRASSSTIGFSGPRPTTIRREPVDRPATRRHASAMTRGSLYRCRTPIHATAGRSGRGRGGSLVKLWRSK